MLFDLFDDILQIVEIKSLRKYLIKVKSLIKTN